MTFQKIVSIYSRETFSITQYRLGNIKPIKTIKCISSKQFTEVTEFYKRRWVVIYE